MLGDRKYIDTEEDLREKIKEYLQMEWTCMRRNCFLVFLSPNIKWVAIFDTEDRKKTLMSIEYAVKIGLIYGIPETK